MESINGGKNEKSNEKFDVETELGKALLLLITKLGDKFDKYLDLSITSELEDRSNRLVRRDRYDRVMELKTQIEEIPGSRRSSRRSRPPRSTARTLAWRSSSSRSPRRSPRSSRT